MQKRTKRFLSGKGVKLKKAGSLMGMRLRELIGRTILKSSDCGGLVPLKGAARWPTVLVTECLMALVVPFRTPMEEGSIFRSGMLYRKAFSQARKPLRPN